MFISNLMLNFKIQFVKLAVKFSNNITINVNEGGL